MGVTVQTPCSSQAAHLAGRQGHFNAGATGKKLWFLVGAQAFTDKQRNWLAPLAAARKHASLAAQAVGQSEA